VINYFESHTLDQLKAQVRSEQSIAHDHAQAHFPLIKELPILSCSSDKDGYESWPQLERDQYEWLETKTEFDIMLKQIECRYLSRPGDAFVPTCVYLTGGYVGANTHRDLNTWHGNPTKWMIVIWQH
jgi:hypothetical protein